MEMIRTSSFAELIVCNNTLMLSAGPESSLVRLVTSDAKILHAIAEVLQFCETPSPLDEILEVADGLIDDSDRAIDLIASLLEQGILGYVEQFHEYSGPRSPYDLKRILFSRRYRRFHDYSDSLVFATDHSLMEGYLSQSAPPALEHHIEGNRIQLPHPAVKNVRGPLSSISWLLFAGFGRLRPARFLDLLDVQLKMAPSDGARHPFDAYVRVPVGQSIPSGVYGYIPSAHSLVEVPAAGVVPMEGPLDYTVHVKAIFERVMWRYRHSASYESIALDFGHLLETLRAVGSENGLVLKKTCLPAIVRDQPLVAEQILQFDVASPAA
jgi:hypothetical protein